MSDILSDIVFHTLDTSQDNIEWYNFADGKLSIAFSNV